MWSSLIEFKGTVWPWHSYALYSSCWIHSVHYVCRFFDLWKKAINQMLTIYIFALVQILLRHVCVWCVWQASICRQSQWPYVKVVFRTTMKSKCFCLKQSNMHPPPQPNDKQQILTVNPTDVSSLQTLHGLRTKQHVALLSSNVCLCVSVYAFEPLCPEIRSHECLS